MANFPDTEAIHVPDLQSGPRNGRLRIGVSACLMGQPVRYDGAHKHDATVAALAREFELVPVCPEVGIGLGVPRPPLQLEGDLAAPRAVGVTLRSLDVTDALRDFGTRAAIELSDLRGFVFKSRSPSCGLDSTPVHRADGSVRAGGTGLFALALMAALPHLPVEENDRLADPQRLADFLRRVKSIDSTGPAHPA